jgi:putative endonuclease
MKKIAYVYFMSNKNNNVLYVGITNDIVRRVAEHKAKVNKSFTYKYNVDKLVYFEQIDSIIDAIAREKQIKNWKREWKNGLINETNPTWEDLSDSIGVSEELIKEIADYWGIAGQARNDVQQADDKAEAEYEEFNKTQKIISDFDKEIKKMIYPEGGANE